MSLFCISVQQHRAYCDIYCDICRGVFLGIRTLLFLPQFSNQVVHDVGVAHKVKAEFLVVEHTADIGLRSDYLLQFRDILVYLLVGEIIVLQ